MAVNKVIYGDQTLIDITDTTATASDVATGKYIYLANGEKVQGTNTGSGGGGVHVETIDKTFSNTNGGTTTTITVSDGSYDNYLITYAIIESGTYTDGVLTMDETVTVPYGNNTAVAGVTLIMPNMMTFNGKINTTSQSNYAMRTMTSSARSSSTTLYAITNGSSISGTTLTVRAYTASNNSRFGGTGKYYKYRFKVYAWNEPAS